VSSESKLASGEVDSMVLMRTMVRSRRASSVPTRAQDPPSSVGAELAAQRFARGFELAADTADAARPGVAAQRVDHRATHSAFGKGLELDAAGLVIAVGGIHQTEHAILDEVARSMECGIVDAIRRASDSTKGKPAATRCC
jgi:hypothetical protein